MVTDGQRRVLILAAIAGMVVFVLQPRLDSGAHPVGWFPFHWAEAEIGAQSVVLLFPNYPMLAVEFLTLAFVTACLYLASGRRE